MPDREARYAWDAAGGRGRQTLVVTYGTEAITGRGRILLEGDSPADVTFTVVLDARWRTRAVAIADAISARRLDLVADGAGAWSSAGQPVPALDGALDVDLSESPFSNTFPIRRSRLDVGAHLDIVTAYVSIPDLAVSPDPQRYTRLDERSYRFDSLDSDFTRDITVDADGFVIEYPGLFTRTDAAEAPPLGSARDDPPHGPGARNE